MSRGIIARKKKEKKTREHNCSQLLASRLITRSRAGRGA